LQLRFKRHGISVVRAFEGVEGIQMALTRPAEAIILDYNLPNGRGDYVLRQLKANPLTKAIPVIVVSGQKRSGLEKEMLHLGAARFFAKPVRFDALLEELQRHIAVAL
jgi:DNA-binding response OmpR family regulator